MKPLRVVGRDRLCRRAGGGAVRCPFGRCGHKQVDVVGHNLQRHDGKMKCPFFVRDPLLESAMGLNDELGILVLLSRST
jgi:hypothetical protein